MTRPEPLPSCFEGRVFTTQEAYAAGLTKDVLSRRCRRIHRGIHCYEHTVVTAELAVDAARRLLPGDATLSHVSGLRWLGVTIGPPTPLHFSTNTTSQTALDGVVLHRRQGLLSPQIVRGVPVLGADRTFVDCATQLGHVDLIRAGDWLVRLGLTTPDTLQHYADERHLDGVRRARRVAPYVVERVDSPIETEVRLMMMFARLPPPEVNVDIVDGQGLFVARGDLVFREYRLIVEYDGWHHERDAHQRQRDHLRRELLESLGWRLVVITVEDLRDRPSIVRRVHRALVQGGYAGPDPVMSLTWRQWFVS